MKASDWISIALVLTGLGLMLGCGEHSTEASDGPRIVAGPIAARADTMVVISWETDRLCLSRVQYRPVGGYYDYAAYGQAYAIDHVFVIAGLPEYGVTYQYTVTSTDESRKRSVTSEQRTFDSGASAQAIADSGWSAFELGDLEGASVCFRRALTRDRARADTYGGLAWAAMRLDSLAIAAVRFERAIRLEPTGADHLGGQASVRAAQGMHAQAVELANAALTSQPNWVFSHDRRIGAASLRVLLASSYFILGNYRASLSQVQMLNPGFVVDVTTVMGRAALAVEIERLGGVLPLS